MSNLTNQEMQQLYQNFFDTSSKVEQCIVDYNETYNLYPPYSVKSIQRMNTCPNNIPSSKSSNYFSKNLIYIGIIMQKLLLLLLL